MRRFGVRLAPILALLSAALVSACSNSATGPTVTVAQLIGPYTLVSLVVSGTAVPGASGELFLSTGATSNTGN